MGSIISENMEFPEQWDECAQKGVQNYSHEVWFGCIERLCQAEQILCDNTTVQGKLWQEHLEENKNWMRSKSPLVRLTTSICKTKIGEVMVHTVLNTCVVLGNFYCWVNTRNDLPGEQTNCLRPFSSVKKWLPSPRTCLKTRTFELKEVKHITHKHLKTLLGLVAFEKQVKLSATTSIPEIFGIQFIKVMKDSSQDPVQTDPLDFVAYFNAFRNMELNQKVGYILIFCEELLPS